MEYSVYKGMFEPDLTRPYDKLKMAATSNCVRINKQEMYGAADMRANQIMLEEVSRKETQSESETSTNTTQDQYIYTALQDQPNDWSTSYTNYYESDGNNGYKSVTGDVAPTFVANKYFIKVKA